MTRGGGTLIVELVIVVGAIALLANVGLPVIQNAAIAHRASCVVHDLERVRAAAERFHGETRDWPPTAPPGQTPAELASNLPPGFSFQSAHYQLAWERWAVSDGTARGGREDELVAVSVIADDERLAARVAEVLGNRGTHFTLGNRTTFVIAEPAAATK
jgi:hypothetical protein